MTPRPPRTHPAVVADLSPTLRAVIYGKGSTILIRSGRPVDVNDLEMAKLRLTYDTFMRASEEEE